MKKKGSRFNMQDSGVRLFLVGLIFFLMITNVFAETREFIFTVTDGEIGAKRNKVYGLEI